MAPDGNMNHSSTLDLLLDGEAIEVRNPSDGALIGRVANEGTKGVSFAVERASQAQAPWASLLPRERGAIMMRWHRLILENAEGLAALMTLEQGKPVQDAKGEIAYAASFIEWFAEEGSRLYGDAVLRACA